MLPSANGTDYDWSSLCAAGMGRDTAVGADTTSEEHLPVGTGMEQKGDGNTTPDRVKKSLRRGATAALAAVRLSKRISGKRYAHVLVLFQSRLLWPTARLRKRGLFLVEWKALEKGRATIITG